MSKLRALHLSDFHAGMGEQKRLFPLLRDDVLDDLARVTQEAPVDVVLFTGDLTQKGSRDEFEQFDKEFARIVAALPSKQPPPVLLAVPGNHDLMRPKVNGAVRTLTKLWDQDASARSEFWANDPNAPTDTRSMVELCFDPYVSWWRERTKSLPADVRIRHGALPGDFSATIEKSGLRVGVVGLNSAWLQLTGDDFERKLDVDVRQLNAAVDGDASEWFASHHFSLLLTHHPPHWLSPRCREEFDGFLAKPGRFALHLFGHMHEPKSSSEAYNGLPAVDRLQAPSLFGLEEVGATAQRILGYSLIEFEVRGAKGSRRFWPRRATKVGSTLVLNPDTQFKLDAHNSVVGSFEVRTLASDASPSATPATTPVASAVHGGEDSLAQLVSQCWSVFDDELRFVIGAGATLGAKAKPDPGLWSGSMLSALQMPKVASLQRVFASLPVADLPRVDLGARALSEGELLASTLRCSSWIAPGLLARPRPGARLLSPRDLLVVLARYARGAEVKRAFRSVLPNLSEAALERWIDSVIEPARATSTDAGRASGEAKRSLRVVLAKLYASPRAALVLSDAGVDTTRVDTTGAPIDVWFEAIEEAERQGKLDRLAQRALSDYPNNAELRAAVEGLTPR